MIDFENFPVRILEASNSFDQLSDSLFYYRLYLSNTCRGEIAVHSRSSSSMLLVPSCVAHSIKKAKLLC